MAQPNDYVRKRLGLQDVIMTRDRDGQLHLLLNRCAHRGNQVCDDAKGNSSAFRCPYHGWTYRNNGDLLGFPFFKGYGGTQARPRAWAGCRGWSPTTDSCSAASLPTGRRLTEHLGAAAGEIDRLARLSPQGKVELTAGWLQHQTRPTGSCWPRTKPTAITRSSCTARSSGSPAAPSGRSTATPRRP